MIRLVPRLGGGLLFAATAAITTLVVVACAKGTDNAGTDTDEGGIVEDATGRDVNVIPTPKDAAAGDTSTTPDKDSGGSCTGKVVINEVKTDGTNANDEMVELYNPDTCAVDLGNWELKYESSGGGAGSAGHKFASGASIGSKSYLVLTPSGSTPWTFGMAASAGQLGLLDDTGKLVDAVAYGSVTTGSYREGQSAPSPASNGSIGRSPNGGDTNNNKTDFKGYGTPSPGIANP